MNDFDARTTLGVASAQTAVRPVGSHSNCDNSGGIDLNYNSCHSRHLRIMVQALGYEPKVLRRAAGSCLLLTGDFAHKTPHLTKRSAAQALPVTGDGLVR
jgi:hypothetical protein